MGNKKGLSQVVTTVIFVALAILAIWIVWTAIQGIIQTQSSSASAQSECFGVAFDIDSVDCATEYNVCSVQITRKAGGGTIDSVKVVVTDGENSDSADGDAMDALDTATIEVELEEVEGVVNKATAAGIVQSTTCPDVAEFDVETYELIECEDDLDCDDGDEGTLDTCVEGSCVFT